QEQLRLRHLVFDLSSAPGEALGESPLEPAELAKAREDLRVTVRAARFGWWEYLLVVPLGSLPVVALLVTARVFWGEAIATWLAWGTLAAFVGGVSWYHVSSSRRLNAQRRA